MANTSFSAVKISGIVTCVPERVCSFADDAALMEMSPNQINRIQKNIGLDKRHVARTETTTLDLCVEAATDLLSGLGVASNAVDGLVFVTQTPDHLQPSNAAIIHGRLGLSTSCASFDVNLGCSGFVYGLWLAHMMIASGTCTSVLLFAGDTLSKCVNPKDRSVAPLFGDAGSATLVQASADNRRTYFSLHTDGSGSEHIRIPAGGFRQPRSAETTQETVTADGNVVSANDLQMNGGEVFNFSIKVEPAAIAEIVEYSGYSLDDVDFVVFHQANKYIISNIVRRIGMPLEKAPCGTVAKYGNQSSASIPATINDALAGNVFGQNKKLILSGFGVGLSWASCLVDMNLDYCPPVKICKGR
ncbi:3-oxoacyl-ACP synthase III family protein [Kordiimonas sp.]|uniref:3-oxoacyl-ACP synthase III family protein n=1 Tax=Kordiimonas sp. TaxID=1970157 RepID=UPI003A8F24CF